MLGEAKWASVKIKRVRFNLLDLIFIIEIIGPVGKRIVFLLLLFRLLPWIRR